MKKPIASQFVVVRWWDACNESTRTDETELAKVKLAENINYGWVVHSNSERILLAHGFSSSGEVDHFSIPTGNIISQLPIPEAAEE